MNRVEAITHVFLDIHRSPADRETAKQILLKISKNSSDTKERQAACRALGPSRLDELLSLAPRTVPSAAPVSAQRPPELPATQLENKSDTQSPKPQPTEPAAEAKPEHEDKQEHEPKPANIEHLVTKARLNQVLSGANTTIAEIDKFLEPEAKKVLGINQRTEMRVRRLRNEGIDFLKGKHSDQESQDQAGLEMFNVIVGAHKFTLAAWERDKIMSIRADAIKAITNCANHRKEQCDCLLAGTRLLDAFRQQYGPDFEEWKVATEIWSELEEFARNRPRNSQPLPDFTRTEQLDESDENTDFPWVGRRRKPS